MNVGDLLKGLSYGELRHVFAGMDGAGTISDTDRDRVVHFANLALKHIHARVSHNQHYVILELVAGRKSYPIQKAYAESDSTPGNTNPRYLKDAEDPLTGSLIKIREVIQIYDPTDPDAEPLVIRFNDSGARSLVTTSYDTLRFSDPVAGSRYEIELQMAPTMLSLPAVETETIEILPMLEEALFVKVAAQFFGAMGGAENAAKAQGYEARFEALMATAMIEDMAQQGSSHEDGKLVRNGWV